MLDSDGITTRSHSRLDSTTETRILGFEFPGLLFLLYHGDAQMLTGSAYHIKGSTRVKKKKSMKEFQGNAPSQPFPLINSFFFSFKCLVRHIFKLKTELQSEYQLLISKM